MLRRGDVPAALGFLDSAEATYRAQGVVPRELLLTRGELLLSVGAFDEARQTAERAIEQLTAAGWRSLLAEAQLLLSQAQLAGNDVAAAQRAATAAATLFGRQRRPGWATVARYTALRADERAGELTPQLRRRALREAGRLAGMGWRAQELDARLIAARVSLALGDVGTVRRELHQAAAARTRGSTELRIRAWYAEALVRFATGREAAAERALRAGFRVMEEQRATLGATELRVHVASHAHDVATLGIQIAVRGGSPRKVLDWAERWRAGALALRPVRPPADEELAAALVELRRVSAEAEGALLDSRPVDRLLGRRRTLEERVRRLAQQAAGPLFAPPAGAADGGAAGGRARRCGAGRADRDRGGRRAHRGHGPGRRAAAARAGQPGGVPAGSWARCCSRCAGWHSGTDSPAAALAQVVLRSARLEATVLGPLRDVLADRPIVVVPTGSLRSVPWALLPMCVGRPVTVAPSASVWLRASQGRNERDRRRSRRRPAGRRVVLVCGPGLAGATAEISALAAVYPEAVRLEGPAATVERVQAALDGAGRRARGRTRGAARRQPAVLRPDDVGRPADRVRPRTAVPGAAAGAAAGLPVRRRGGAGRGRGHGTDLGAVRARHPYRGGDRGSGARRSDPAADARTT